MKTRNIIGGVSPLKKRQATRGGKYAKYATGTERRRGGFAPSVGAKAGADTRGAGGINVGGYNVQTSFKPGAAWVKPTSTGFTPTIPEKTIGQKIIEGDPKGGTGEQFRTLPGEEAKKGNEFADNCYDAAGKLKEGHTYYSDIKKGMIACMLGGKSDGSFGYDKDATDDRLQRRTFETDPEGNPIPGTYTDYEDWEKDVIKK